MKKQNYLSAVLILLLSLGCFIGGYWVADSERQELARVIVRSVESDRQFKELDTRDDLEMLIALKNGKLDMVEKYLMSEIRAGLKAVSKTNIKLKNKALDYQTSYCVDKCLGLDPTQLP